MLWMGTCDMYNMWNDDEYFIYDFCFVNSFYVKIVQIFYKYTESF